MACAYSCNPQLTIITASLPSTSQDPAIHPNHTSYTPNTNTNSNALPSSSTMPPSPHAHLPSNPNPNSKASTSTSNPLKKFFKRLKSPSSASTSTSTSSSSDALQPPRPTKLGRTQTSPPVLEDVRVGKGVKNAKGAGKGKGKDIVSHSSVNPVVGPGRARTLSSNPFPSQSAQPSQPSHPPYKPPILSINTNPSSIPPQQSDPLLRSHSRSPITAAVSPARLARIQTNEIATRFFEDVEEDVEGDVDVDLGSQGEGGGKDPAVVVDEMHGDGEGEGEEEELGEIRRGRLVAAPAPGMARSISAPAAAGDITLRPENVQLPASPLKPLSTSLTYNNDTPPASNTGALGELVISPIIVPPRSPSGSPPRLGQNDMSMVRSSSVPSTTGTALTDGTDLDHEHGHGKADGQGDVELVTPVSSVDRGRVASTGAGVASSSHGRGKGDMGKGKGGGNRRRVMMVEDSDEEDDSEEDEEEEGGLAFGQNVRAGRDRASKPLHDNIKQSVPTPSLADKAAEHLVAVQPPSANEQTGGGLLRKNGNNSSLYGLDALLHQVEEEPLKREVKVKGKGEGEEVEHVEHIDHIEEVLTSPTSPTKSGNQRNLMGRKPSYGLASPGSPTNGPRGSDSHSPNGPPQPTRRPSQPSSPSQSHSSSPVRARPPKQGPPPPASRRFSLNSVSLLGGGSGGGGGDGQKAATGGGGGGGLFRSGTRRVRESVYGLGDLAARSRSPPPPQPVTRRLSVSPTMYSLGDINRETAAVMDKDEKALMETFYCS